MKYSSLKVIDLFSGCGGLSLGFQKSGFEIVTAFENWKPAINVYQQNFHHPIFDYDLSQVNNNYSILLKEHSEAYASTLLCARKTHNDLLIL